MPLMRRTVEKVGVWIAGLVIIAGATWFLLPSALCRKDVARTAVHGTNWEILVKTNSCSAIDGTSMISAINVITKKEIVIAFINEATDFSVRVISPRKIEVKIPNLSDFTPRANSFGDVSVEYSFVPKNDPGARAQYQFWAHHPNDPRAIRWYREHFKNSQ